VAKVLKKRKRKNKKDDSTPVDFNVPTFSESSFDRERAKKKVRSQLEALMAGPDGISLSDVNAAYDRGKLTMNPNTGQYTFSTNVYSE
tara:strand:+ start:67 stop:330 length:264 start_codon:yes stop_codon:yes gene_type:complete